MSQKPLIFVFQSNDVYRRALRHTTTHYLGDNVDYPNTASDLLMLVDDARQKGVPIMVVSSSFLQNDHDCQILGNRARPLPRLIVGDSPNIHFFWFSLGAPAPDAQGQITGIIPKDESAIGRPGNDLKAGYLIEAIRVFRVSGGDPQAVVDRIESLKSKRPPKA